MIETNMIKRKMAHVSFTVSSVFPETSSLCLPRSPASDVFINTLESKDRLACPDSHSSHSELLSRKPHRHGLLAAILIAFHNHLPLSLRPEHFWLLILQAVTKHVRQNSEHLRYSFVKHEGKEAIELIRDEFKLGKRGNDWPGLVAEFAQEIEKRTVPGTFELVSANFSTTTAVELVASQIAIMDMLQDFFEYRFHTLCGFPKITLEGTLQDWQLLRVQAEKLISEKCLSAFGHKWQLALLPVLDRFVEQYKNPTSVDVHFWDSMAKKNWPTLSGAQPLINGWINVFFPLYKDDKPNPFCVPYSKDTFNAETGSRDTYIPGGWSVAPAIWTYFEKKIELEFRAGFVGVSQDEDGTIRPEIGWSVVRTS